MAVSNMNGTRVASQLDTSRSFLGIPLPWAITIMATVLMWVFTTNLYSFGVFFKPMAADMGWSRAVLSGAFSLRMIITAIVTVPMAMLCDRYGPRRVVVPSLIVLGSAVALMGMVNSIWQLYAVQGALIGIAMPGPYVILLTTVGKWHNKRSGLAMGITSGGAALGSIIFPLLSSYLVEAVGWRSGLIALGAIAVAVGLFPAAFLRSPAIGYEGAGGVRADNASGGALDMWRDLPRYMRQPLFLSISIMFFLFGITYNLFIAHFVNYATDVRVTSVVAAAMVSAMGLSSLAGRLASGLLSDNFGVRSSLVLCFGMVAVGIVLLLWNASVGMMWVGAALFGLGQGGELPLVPAVLRERYGKDRLTTMTGVVQTFVMAGGGLGPYFGGAMFDWTGTYSWALAVVSGMAAASLLLAWRLGPAVAPVPKRG